MPYSARSEALSSAEAARVAGISLRHLKRLLAARKIEEPARCEASGYLRWTLADVETIKASLTYRKPSQAQARPRGRTAA